MDTNMTKIKDEDETMNSGADMDAFTAELNKDVEVTSRHPSDSENDGGKENQRASIGISNTQATATVNRHSSVIGMKSQQALSSGITVQQPGNSLKLNKQVPFGMLLPIIQPQLDKDRAMQLHTLYFKLKKNEVTKDGFVRIMRSIVGDHMLKMAVYKLQNQSSRNSQSGLNQFMSQPQAYRQQLQGSSSAQMLTEIPANNSGTTRSHEDQIHQNALYAGASAGDQRRYAEGTSSAADRGFAHHMSQATQAYLEVQRARAKEQEELVEYKKTVEDAKAEYGILCYNKGFEDGRDSALDSMIKLCNIKS